MNCLWCGHRDSMSDHQGICHDCFVIYKFLMAQSREERYARDWYMTLGAILDRREPVDTRPRWA